jgi:hypothetical protein
MFCIFIICYLRRFFCGMIMIFAFSFAREYLYIARFFIPYCSAMNRNGINNTWHFHLWPADTPHGSVESTFNIDFQWMSGANWWKSIVCNINFGTTFNCCELSAVPTKELPLLMDVLLETRLWIFFQHDGASPYFGHQVMAYLNQRYENRRFDSAAPTPWPPRSPDFTCLISFYGGNALQVQIRVEPWRRIINAAVYIWEHPETIQRAASSCFNRSRLCIENRGGYFGQLPT